MEDNKMQTLKELMESVEKEMHRQQYNFSTIATYKMEWRRILEYAKE
jgi:hypothetical protein